MKKILVITLACGLSVHMAWAQQNPDVNSPKIKQQKDQLEALTAPIDTMIKVRSNKYYSEQAKKVTYDSIGTGAFRADVAKLKNHKKDVQMDFIKKHPDYYISLLALEDVIGPIPTNLPEIKTLYSQLTPQVRKTPEGVKTKMVIDKFDAVSIGKIAPEFASTDTAGNVINLKSFRGKYLLIDFWASWCMPCREENPNVVKAYNRFHNKNFEILSVSLDQPGAKKDWINAIKKDGLNWQHVSDLQYWKDKTAQLYVIKSIPQNFLIDPYGKIIAKDLRGDALTNKLQEVLGM